ncbi:ATP-binding protein [Lichenibacterium minor]|uniref:ATP-binding protein n=1 Tax=Lichenibacterium minor TaxID=2316528 RepID=A0A4Q2U1Q0_9HYPH|nr:AAA family ATPase [Lichenibacterium minor]RYC30222.1 ATP-binding protein [Lichenibacterium minor]
MISALAVTGYRSLRDVRLGLGALNVVTGANGSGKSSLYRALRLLADAAQGRVVASLAAEGGMGSAQWAGPKVLSRAMKRGDVPVQGQHGGGPVSLKLGFGGDDFGYAVDLGLPIVSASLFFRDPVIKAEAAWTGPRLKRSTAFARREGPGARLLSEGGAWRAVPSPLGPADSLMTHCADPRGAPELLDLRERMRAWRFYDHLRTDRDAPARRPQVGTYTPALASDGADLAAALQTVREIGDAFALDAAVEDAFPGAAVSVTDRDGLFDVGMRQPGLLRPLGVAELSEGTLRYLLLVAALLSPRPAPLTVLNEPEASLHPDLIAPLARLIGAAAERAQVVVVSHAAALVEALDALPGARRFTLEKRLGETVVEGEAALGWAWPER